MSCGADKDKPLPTTEVPVSKIVKPQVKKADATCLDEPKPDLGVKTDLDLARYNEAVRLAGGDCRAKLHSLANQVDVVP